MESKAPLPFKSPNPDEYWLGERVFVREIMNAPEEADVSLARFRVPAGISTQLHSLTVTEWYILESGSGLVEIDGKAIKMSAGENIKIAPSKSQRVINSGGAELVFQSICMPRWTPECYTNLEKNNES